jgi:hypothetical protein
MDILWNIIDFIAAVIFIGLFVGISWGVVQNKREARKVKRSYKSTVESRLDV